MPPGSPIGCMLDSHGRSEYVGGGEAEIEYDSYVVSVRVLVVCRWPIYADEVLCGEVRGLLELVGAAAVLWDLSVGHSGCTSCVLAHDAVTESLSEAVLCSLW